MLLTTLTTERRKTQSYAVPAFLALGRTSLLPNVYSFLILVYNLPYLDSSSSVNEFFT